MTAALPASLIGNRQYCCHLLSSMSRQVDIPFSAFRGNADLRNVGAVELVFRGMAGAQPTFDSLAVGLELAC